MKSNPLVVEHLEALLKDAQAGRLQGFVAVGVEVPKGSKGETQVSKIRYTTAGDVDSAVDLIIAGLERVTFEIKAIERERDPIFSDKE